MITNKELIKLKIKKNFFLKQKLSNYSWFNLGGFADILFKPKNLREITSFLKNYKNTKFTILGAGSNTLIRDGGIKGITIKLSSKFAYLKILKGDIIEAGAATLDRKLSEFAKEKSLAGFEFLSCIPGSVGGAVKMNSGCYGSDISKILYSIKVIDKEVKKKEIFVENIKFSYRGCNLPDNLIIISVKFKGKKSTKTEIDNKQKTYIERKKKSQPSQIKTCGSTFKNTLNKKAWKLIKDSGCVNYKVGNAEISKKHCNFFVNNGKATSAEIEQLIAKVKNKVLKETKVNLDLELKIVGYNK